MKNYFEGLKSRAAELIDNTKTSKSKIEAIVSVISKYFIEIVVIFGCAAYFAIKSVIFMLHEIWRAFKYVVNDIELAMKESSPPVNAGVTAKNKKESFPLQEAKLTPSEKKTVLPRKISKK